MNPICESCRNARACWEVTFFQRPNEPTVQPFHVCDNCLVVDNQSEIEVIDHV